MSVEWTSNEEPEREVRREHTAAVEGLRVTVVETPADRAFSWTAHGYLDDFRLDAYDYLAAASVEEAKAAAVAAARRLLELGARGTR